jgi:hypothetical protein
MIRAILVTVALLAGGAAASAQAPAEPGMDPAVARCVLDNLERARGWTDGEVVVRACKALLSGADGGTGQPVGAGPGSYLVQCRVPTDPAWVEFRLISRDQCDRLNGTATLR